MIDPRLFPLFETLSRANLDWLIREIFDVIELGEVPLASEEELLRVRQRISEREEKSAFDLPEMETVGEARQYSGHEQIRIAGSLVVSRITDSLVMTKYSIERLDALVGVEFDNGLISAAQTTVKLIDDVGEQPSRSVDMDAIRISFEALFSLRQAVEQWQETVMVGDPVMIPAISAALNAIVGNAVNLQNANGAGRAYELYMMTAIADRLRTAGAQVRIKRSDGSFVLPTDANRSFVQRGGAPSGLPGSSQGPGNMSTIAFRLSGSARDWEIWNGVQFNGRSGGQHEFDLAIVSSHTADTIRARPAGGAPFGRPAVAVECKDVASAGSVDEMRALVARIYDVTALTGHEPFLSWASTPMSSIYPGQAHLEPAQSSFRNSNMNSYSALVRRTGFTSGATAVSGYYFIQPFADVFPGSAQETVFLTNLTSWIASNLA